MIKMIRHKADRRIERLKKIAAKSDKKLAAKMADEETKM
jgi:hypothetical protein